MAGRKHGFTIVEMLIVVLIIALLIAIVMPSLAKAREASQQANCASNMRQIGLGIWQYEKDYTCLPNAQWNAWRELMEYYGLRDANRVVRTKCGPVVSWYSTLFKCPANEFVNEVETGHSLSYAPLVDSGYIDGDNDGVADGNVKYCAWTTCRTGYEDGGKTARGKAWHFRNFANSAPDTAILVEYYSPVNRIQFNQETPPGYMLVDWGGATRMGTINWTGPALNATAPLSDVASVGGYTFLSVYGYEASRTGISRTVNGVVHHGSMNVLCIDGSVTPRRVKDVTSVSPKDVPMWTRSAD